jgi:hypothetical protein
VEFAFCGSGYLSYKKVTAVVPTFVIVTDLAALVVLTATVPKLSETGTTISFQLEFRDGAVNRIRNPDIRSIESDANGSSSGRKSSHIQAVRGT